MLEEEVKELAYVEAAPEETMFNSEESETPVARDPLRV